MLAEISYVANIHIADVLLHIGRKPVVKCRIFQRLQVNAYHTVHFQHCNFSQFVT